MKSWPWRRARTVEPPRQPPTSDDPFGTALAAPGDVVSRFPGEELNVNDLRKLIHVAAMEPMQWRGFNTVVGLPDEIWSYADTAGDGLESALADQPGIDDVHHMDREEMRVRSSLSLADVHAAAIRALLEINRLPRPVPRLGLSLSTLSDLATGIAPVLAGRGFVGRLRMVVDEDGGEPSGPHGFYRTCEERLLQVLRLWCAGRAHDRH